MEKLSLLRKISVIHAIKCNLAYSFDVAENSFQALNELKKSVIEAENKDIERIIQEIDNWANTEPIASQIEIINLMRK